MGLKKFLEVNNFICDNFLVGIMNLQLNLGNRVRHTPKGQKGLKGPKIMYGKNSMCYMSFGFKNS
jgi:hypothetical protein